MKSTSFTAAFWSSVIVSFAPYFAARSLRDLLVLLGRPQRLRAADAHIHAHQAAHDHQRVPHVGARVADVGVLDLLHRLVAVLAHRHHVGEHLRRVVLVGQAVVDRHAGPLRQRLHARLRGAAVLDRVEHAPEHARGVLEGFLVPDLRAGRVEVGHVRALVAAGHLEGAARARRGLLEDQADFLALEVLLLGARVLGALEVAGEVEQVLELLLRVVLHGEQGAVAKIESHDVGPLITVRLWCSWSGFSRTGLCGPASAGQCSAEAEPTGVQ